MQKLSFEAWKNDVIKLITPYFYFLDEYNARVSEIDVFDGKPIWEDTDFDWEKTDQDLLENNLRHFNSSIFFDMESLRKLYEADLSKSKIIELVSLIKNFNFSDDEVMHYALTGELKPSNDWSKALCILNSYDIFRGLSWGRLSESFGFLKGFAKAIESKEFQKALIEYVKNNFVLFEIYCNAILRKEIYGFSLFKYAEKIAKQACPDLEEKISTKNDCLRILEGKIIDDLVSIDVDNFHNKYLSEDYLKQYVEKIYGHKIANCIISPLLENKKQIVACIKNKKTLTYNESFSKLPKYVLGDIILNGASKYVKDICGGLGCSKAEATRYLMEGKFYIEDFVPKAFSRTYRDTDAILYDLAGLYDMNLYTYLYEYEYEYGYDTFAELEKELFDVDGDSKINNRWMKVRWILNKADSAEWDKPRKEYGPANNTLEWTYRDWVGSITDEDLINGYNTCLDTAFKLCKKRVIKRLQAFQTRLPEILQERMLKQVEWENTPFKLCPLAGNEVFKQLMTPKELRKAGEHFSNCVATYAHACLENRSFIFASENICAEIVPDDFGGWYVAQCSSFHNEQPTAKDRKAFDQWFKSAVQKAKTRIKTKN